MLKQHLLFIRYHVIICRSDLQILVYFFFCLRLALFSQLPPSLWFSHIRQWFNDYIKEWGNYGEGVQSPDRTDTLAQMPLRCVDRLYPSERLQPHKAAGGAGLHDQVRKRKVQEETPNEGSLWLHFWSWDILDTHDVTVAPLVIPSSPHTSDILPPFISSDFFSDHSKKQHISSEIPKQWPLAITGDVMKVSLASV